jgi:CheY-like chemotaxis protein
MTSSWYEKRRRTLPSADFPPKALTMLFAEEDPKLMVSPEWRPKNTWCVLMVDDDAVVHTVTRLALRGYEFRGRSLEFISAFSGKEGQRVFEDRQDIAVAIVDVVMERDLAGLELVDYVRHTLDNHHTRMVVRTGQPGLVSRQNGIDQHEIDDYREKTELTIQKLRTLLDTQLSAYGEPVRAVQ